MEMNVENKAQVYLLNILTSSC